MTEDEMRADLEANGWTEERPGIWRQPYPIGKCYRFPGAWRRMDYARTKALAAASLIDGNVKESAVRPSAGDRP